MLSKSLSLLVIFKKYADIKIIRIDDNGIDIYVCKIYINVDLIATKNYVRQ